MLYISGYIFLGANADLSVLLDSVSASQYARDYNSRNFSGHEVFGGLIVHLNRKTASLF
jgi:hypothetical protein